MCAEIAKGIDTREQENKSPASKASSYDMSASNAGAAQRSARRKKSAAAFRTISEVADDLGVKQHVLRFWETKFSQLKPLKRGGGRRYYRPEDIDLLKAVHRLLYIEGYTIKGVQKLLRDAGKKQIVTMFSSGEGLEKLPSAAEIASSPEGQAYEPKTRKSAALTPEQRKSLETVLEELKELRGMIKTRK